MLVKKALTPAKRHPWGPLGLDLVTLRMFAATAEEGSLARAADREAIALSAISRRISTLEARSGVQLFDRRDRGMSLTPAGESLFHRLEGVFDLLDQVALDLEAARSGTRGIVRIHTHMAATAGGLAGQLASFIATHPGLDVRVEEHTSTEVVHAVSTNTAEIGLISGTVDPGELEVVRWCSDRLVTILPANDPLVSKAHVRFEDIADRCFIAMQKDSSLLSLYRNQARLMGKQIIERAHVSSFESVRLMVAAGLGVSIIPAGAIDEMTETLPIVVKPLTETWANRPLMLCVRSLKHLPAAAKLMVRWLTEPSVANASTTAGDLPSRFSSTAHVGAPLPPILAAV
jgi:DNA-binding transcriptional LysR family regulator